MSNRLFVDVDDTLITWSDPAPIATSWTPNQDVVAYIRRWVAEHPGRSLIIWSSGGEDYARTFAERVIPDLTYVALAKYPLIPMPGDVCIDDAPFDSFKSATIHPRDLERIQ